MQSLRAPLLQINGVRVNHFLSPVKRRAPQPASRSISNENLSPFDEDECVVGLSPFKKRARPDPQPAAMSPAPASASGPRKMSIIHAARPPRRSALAQLIQRFPDTRLTIDSLPHELLYYLFTFLSPEDKLRASQSCRQWYTIVDDRTLWMQYYAFPDEQPAATACRWPARWAAVKRQEEVDRKNLEHNDLFVDHPLHVDTEVKLAEYREAFRVVDEYSLMECSMSEL